MKKDNVILFIIIIILIFIGSISYFNGVQKTNENKTPRSEIYTMVGNYQLAVEYLNEKSINTNLSYNSIYTSIIKISNRNKDRVRFGLGINNLNVNNQLIKYSLYSSLDNIDYVPIIEDNILNDVLGYNLLIDGDSIIYLKLVINSTLENLINIQGDLNIQADYDDEHIMYNNINQEIAIVNKLNIYQNGRYYYQARKLNGYIIIDDDNQQFILYLNNQTHLVNGINYQDLKISNITNYNNETYDLNELCFECLKLE